jgi:hypothetical protein
MAALSRSRTYWRAFAITLVALAVVSFSPLDQTLPNWAWPWGLIPFFWLVFFLLAWFQPPVAPKGDAGEREE